MFKRIRRYTAAAWGGAFLGIVFEAAIKPSAALEKQSDSDLWYRLDMMQMARHLGALASKAFDETEAATREEVERRGLHEPPSRGVRFDVH